MSGKWSLAGFSLVGFFVAAGLSIIYERWEVDTDTVAALARVRGAGVAARCWGFSSPSSSTACRARVRNDCTLAHNRRVPTAAMRWMSRSETATHRASCPRRIEQLAAVIRRKEALWQTEALWHARSLFALILIRARWVHT